MVAIRFAVAAFGSVHVIHLFVELVEAVFIVHGVAKSILKFFQFLWHWVVPGNAIGCLCCLLESALKEAGLLGVILEHGHVVFVVVLVCVAVEALPGCVILYSCLIQS